VSYFAVPTVVVVEAESAEQALDLANSHGEDTLSDNGEAYLGVVYMGQPCAITPEQAGDPDWDAQIIYHGEYLAPEPLED